LYLHYVYLLRRAQKHPANKASFRLRESIRKLDDFIMQTKSLCKYRIDTKGQLQAFIEHNGTERERLVGERKNVNNQKRRTPDAASLAGYQKRSEEITGQLAVIRSEVKAANGVLSRSLETRNKSAGNDHQKEDVPKHPEWVINR
jgi:hypothetical protein